MKGGSRVDTNQNNIASNSARECLHCHRALPSSYTGSICPSCRDNELFREVKEYIRAYDVNEYDVAAHFHIPLRKVKEWIREGRIEYKDGYSEGLAIHCQNCGVKINFGSLCPRCLKLLGGGGHSVERSHAEHSANERMFFNLSDYNRP